MWARFPRAFSGVRGCRGTLLRKKLCLILEQRFMRLRSTCAPTTPGWTSAYGSPPPSTRKTLPIIGWGKTAPVPGGHFARHTSFPKAPHANHQARLTPALITHLHAAAMASLAGPWYCGIVLTAAGSVSLPCVVKCRFRGGYKGANYASVHNIKELLI